MNKKIDKAIERLHKAEKLALALNPTDGYHLAFSGGKDSQCIMELARMAGVKYHPAYSVTGIDAPDNIYFIRDNYPEVEFVHHRKNFFGLVEEKGLPMIFSRFCCERLKERLGAGSVMLDGVRAEESRKRSAYTEIMVRSRRKENQQKGRNRTLEQIEENNHQCIKGKDRIDLHPILDWTQENVWNFIKDRHLPTNPLYEHVGRVGCMFCPFASQRQIEWYCHRYPQYYHRLLKSIDKFLQKKPLLPTAEEYFLFWVSKQPLSNFIDRQNARPLR